MRILSWNIVSPNGELSEGNALTKMFRMVSGRCLTTIRELFVVGPCQVVKNGG